jgi:hypothetical protein
MAEHGRLQLSLIDAAAEDHAEQAPQGPGTARPRALSRVGLQVGSAANGDVRAKVEFLYPTGRKRRSLIGYSVDAPLVGSRYQTGSGEDSFHAGP